MPIKNLAERGTSRLYIARTFCYQKGLVTACCQQNNILSNLKLALTLIMNRLHFWHMYREDAPLTNNTFDFY